MAKVSEVFKGDAVEQMKTIASTGPGGWTEAWARKVMEVGEEGEEEILMCVHRAMREEFGHVVAKKMIKGVRDFVREQREGTEAVVEGKETTIEEERGKGGKGVGMSGGWFWQTGQQEKAGREADQQQREEEEAA